MNQTHPCRYCVAPKRKPGCHNACPEYAAWLPQELERKEAIRRNKAKQVTHLKKYHERKPSMK